MNYEEFQDAKASFRLKTIEKGRKPLYKARKEFVSMFPRSKITSMKIDDYVQGKGDKHTFCYGLEWSLLELGNINGATCKKFGVYYSQDSQNYEFVQKFGSDYKVAFSNIKKSILELLEAGELEDYDAIFENPISTMVKGKILSLYYPELYLNIFSEAHLDYYLRFFDLDTTDLMDSDPVYKRAALVDFKNSDKDMKNWSLDMFSVFLATEYPKAPRNGDEGAVDGIDDELDFPTTDDYSGLI